MSAPECITHEITPGAIPPEQGRHRFKRAGVVAARLLFAASMSVAAVSAFGDSTVKTPHAEVEFHTSLDTDMNGGAVLDTPLGDISYPTHAGPLRLEARIKDIPVDSTIDLFTKSRPRSLGASLEEEAIAIGQGATKHLYKSLAIVGGVGAAAWLISGQLNRLGTRSIAASIVAGSLLAGIPGGVGYATFDDNALNKPEYSGALARAFKSQDALKTLDAYDQDVSRQAGYLFRLLGTLEELNAGEEEETAVRVLVVSDIHGRNVYPFIDLLTEHYGINFILDTGDLVDWGQDFENSFFTGENADWRASTTSIADLDVPYFFSRGNHDSESSTVGALRKIPNVKVLDRGRFFTQNGLIITGAPDPVFSPGKEVEDKDAEKELQIATGKDLQEDIGDGRIDIVATHNPIAAEQIIRGAGITISGHTHKFRFKPAEKLDGPHRLVAGSSGSAGLRVYDNPDQQETPASFTIVNFSADCTPVSLDVLQSTALNGPGFQIRHIPIAPDSQNRPDEDRVCA